MTKNLIIPLLCVFASSFCRTEVQDGRFATFMFPPPGFCFANSKTVYLATSISDGLFLRQDVQQQGMSIILFLNHMELSSVSWTAADGQETDEGLAHHFNIPNLPDGEYSAELWLQSTTTTEQFGWPAKTTFSVDQISACSWQRPPPPPQSARKGRQFLANVAHSAPAWMSSSAEHCEAWRATDGLKMVSTEEHGTAQTEQTEAAVPGGWWEVDLGREVLLDRIDVWEGKRAAPQGSYPPIVSNAEVLEPFEVLVLSTSWAVARSTTFNESMGGVFSWGGISVRGRYVRVRVLEGPSRRRVLSLLEVDVFAWESWDCSRHCKRGRCPADNPTHGLCSCDPDTMGPACDSSVLTDHAYLPPPQPAALSCDDTRWPADECMESRWDRARFEEAVGWIEKGQSPPACSSEYAMVMGYHPGGLAASLSLIASMLSMTLSQGKALLLWRRADWFYADAAECADRQMSCYFEAWHNCSAPDVDDFGEGAFHLKVEESEATRGAQPFAWVPPQYQDLGLFWWRAALNSFLFRLRPALAEELDVDAAMERLGLAGKAFIGVHARLGDSCVKWRELFGGDCVGLDAHVAHVRLLQRRYGVSQVFVASDDPNAADIIQQRLPDLSVASVDAYRHVLLEMEKTKETWTENRLREGEIGARDLLRSTLLDLFILSRARFFVGHLASNLSRLALSLAAAHRGGVIPYISVDGPWCYHWQLCCAVDRDGISHMCS